MPLYSNGSMTPDNSFGVLVVSINISQISQQKKLENFNFVLKTILQEKLTFI